MKLYFLKGTAAVLAVIAGMCQSVYAYDIEVNINSFTFDVSLKSDVDTERPSIQMLDGEKTKILYMGEGSSQQNNDGGYLFSFTPFNVPENLTSGKYIIRVGGKGTETKECEIQFVNTKDKGNALNAVNSAADKEKAITENADALEIDTTLYVSLSSEWKNIINMAVAAEDFSNDCSVEQVEEKQKLFLEIYNHKLELAVIAGSENSTDVYNMIENSSYTGLDLKTWYSKITDKKKVAENICQTDFECDITDEELSEAFDGAVLVNVISQLDWGSGKSAVEYYDEKGIIDVDFSGLNSLSETAQADVFKSLKSSGITNYKDIAGTLEKLIEKESPTEGTGGGSSGGGGGGGGGASTVKPNGGTPVTVTPPEIEQNDEDEIKTESMDFSDMNGYEWAEEAVRKLSAMKVVDGVGNGLFEPSRTITREEFVKIAVLAFDLYDENAECGYTDVPEDAWYVDYVASAKEAGIINGVTDTEFGTGTQITRQDMAVILHRIYKMARLSSSSEPEMFEDRAYISDYAVEAVNAMSAAGIMTGMDNSMFEPLLGVTRAQCAKAVYELVEAVELSGGVD